MNYKKLVASLMVSSALAGVSIAPAVSAQENIFTNQNASQQESKNEKAISAVNALFTDDTYSVLAPSTTAASIKEARMLVLKNASIGDLQYLADLCSKAEQLLNQSTNDPKVQQAIEAVHALFTDDSYSALAPNTTADSIKKAKLLVIKIASNSNFNTLADLCSKAEQLLNQSINDPKVQQAIEAVHALFTDDSYSALAPNTTADSIKKAKLLVIKIASNSNFNTLADLCTKADSLLIQ